MTNDTDYGQPTKTGWAPMVPELLVEEIDRPIAFWQTLLGFEMAYQRPEEKFIYLERPEGAQLMLHQRCDHWETGEMQPPFGRGVMFQIEAEGLTEIEANLAAADWPLHTGPREIWRRLGDVEGGQREIFVQDPDGYLVMLFKNLGERPIST